MAADVFIAYARVDSVIAEQVQAALSDAGLTAIRDVTIDFGGDEAWADRFVDEIHSTKCVLALWTPNSILSGDVIGEATLAAELRILMSVRCDTMIKHPLPIRIAALKAQTVSWNTHSTDGLAEVVRAIHKFIESRSHTELS